MSVLNKTRNTTLARRLLTLNANTHSTLRSLNRAGIPKNCALWIAPCSAVHTVGLKNSVDIAFLNRHGRVVTIYRNFPPECIAESPRSAVSAVELPPDALRESDTDIGDTIELDPN